MFPTLIVSSPMFPTLIVTSPMFPTLIVSSPSVPTLIVKPPMFPTLIVSSPSVPTLIVSPPQPGENAHSDPNDDFPEYDQTMLNTPSHTYAAPKSSPISAPPLYRLCDQSLDHPAIAVAATRLCPVESLLPSSSSSLPHISTEGLMFAPLANTAGVVVGACHTRSPPKRTQSASLYQMTPHHDLKHIQTHPLHNPIDMYFDFAAIPCNDHQHAITNDHNVPDTTDNSELNTDSKV